LQAIADEEGKHPCDYRTTGGETADAAEIRRLYLSATDSLISEVQSRHGSKRYVVKKAYAVDRHVDLICHLLSVHPQQVIDAIRGIEPPNLIEFSEWCNELLSYTVGVVVGRWDIRHCMSVADADEACAPFAHLPVSSPGMLQSPDGYPAAETPQGYPLRIDWDGILVDDGEHQDDIVRRVMEALEVIWKERAESIEKEVCEILGVKSLRDYFRKPGSGGFWDDHVKRYSKSRRKAPIYWLLQSSKKSYALWLYYHRLDKDMLFKALLNYVEPKIKREENRLGELRSRKSSANDSGKGAKKLDRDIEKQEDLLSELRDFADKIRKVANLHLVPDLDDGVVLNIAPLWELVPWSEAKEYWQELLDGKYDWSSMGRQLRDKHVVR
jgi:hypothetical protein